MDMSPATAAFISISLSGPPDDDLAHALKLFFTSMKDIELIDVTLSRSKIESDLTIKYEVYVLPPRDPIGEAVAFFERVADHVGNLHAVSVAPEGVRFLTRVEHPGLDDELNNDEMFEMSAIATSTLKRVGRAAGDEVASRLAAELGLSYP